MASFSDLKLDLQAKGALVSRKHVPDPPGYVPASALGDVGPLVKEGTNSKALDHAARARKEAAMKRQAMEPFKQAGFMCFMLYMSGSSPSVFSIMMMVTCVTSPFVALTRVTSIFKADGQLDVLQPRLIFVAIQLAQLAFAAWRLNDMGLLPTYPSDWMSQMPAPHVLERAVPPLQQR